MAEGIHVTDHAVLRYLERVEGVDVVALRRLIRRAVRRGVAEGATGVIADGVTYKLRERTVVTVVRPHLSRRAGGDGA